MSLQVDDPLVAEQINTLAAFLGMRDVPRLTRQALADEGLGPADVLILIGGSPLAGADVFASAIRDQVAAVSMIVGGRGHTTATLRSHVARELGEPQDDALAEAQLLDSYIRARHGAHADLLETDSTHTGANAANGLAVLRRAGVRHDRIIVVNDATMQRRVDAVFRRQSPATTVVNFAAYRVDVVVEEGRLAYAHPVRGMWSMEHYIALLLGEVVRLRDDEQGYGPRGRGFIAHVDIPAEVLDAHRLLAAEFGHLVRGVDQAPSRP